MKEFDKFIEIIRILRSPIGCLWDRAQKIKDYEKYLLEETYELIEGIHKNDVEIIKEEIGDLFIILVSITEILSAQDSLDLESVFKTVSDKLVLRHPHVFSSKKFKTKDAVLKHWIKDKAKRKKRKTIRDRLPQTAPALLLAGIFFKEYINLKDRLKSNSAQQERLSIIDGLMEKLKSFPVKNDNAEWFVEILFGFCRLAGIYKVDLENLLRKKVIAAAEKISYQT